MIKILYIHHGKSIGGALISLVNLCRLLDKSRYSVQVLLLKGDETVFEFMKENSIEYFIPRSNFVRRKYRFYLHSEASSRNTYNIFRQIIYTFSWIAVRFFYAKKELSRFNPNIIHLNSAFLTDWIKPSSKKAKVVVHVREPMDSGIIGLRNRHFSRQMKLYADHIIAISKDNLKRLSINFGLKASIVYNYVDDQINDYAKVPLIRGKVLYVGGSMTIKGFYNLVDALQFLDQDIIVFFAGPFENNINNRSEKYKQVIRIIENSSNAKLIGLVDNVLLEISSSEFLISPFKKSHFSRPIIEAYSLKKPVIATKIPGIEEMVKDKITGILVENDNPYALACAINDLHKSYSQIESYGLNARTFYERDFSPSNFQKIENIYNTLIR